MQKWCDIGVNLFSSQFDANRETVVDNAAEIAIAHLLLIGSNLDESLLNLEYCQKRRGCYTTFGVHPHQAAEVKSGWQSELAANLCKPSVVAVGECGLDFNRDFSPRDVQVSVFTEQLNLAKEHNKPLYLHERDAFETQIAILKEHQIHHGVAHCFTGNTAELKGYLDLGLYIGITGWLCDERRSSALQEAIKYLPLDRLLLETDAPYLLPRTIKPKPVTRCNEPAYLPYIAEKVSELTGFSMNEIAAVTLENSRRLFGFSHEVSM